MANTPRPTFQELLAQRLTRREVLGAGVAIAAAGSVQWIAPAEAAKRAAPSLSFKPIRGSSNDEVILPQGYTYDLVARWGDSLFSNTASLDATKLPAGVLFANGAAARQRAQFGQNCDAIHYFPLDRSGTRGILCVNNEYTDDALMYPGHPGLNGQKDGKTRQYVLEHPQVVAVSQAAQGVSVIEVQRLGGQWRLVKDSPFNRRITATTPMAISGPARGAELLRTSVDPTGSKVFGTFGNCAGGQTPWGTYLTAEENIQDYFGNLAALQARGDGDQAAIEAHRRFRMWSEHSQYAWEAVDVRFDISKEPREAFRFGWIVEIDPRDPQRTPIKRSALGRFAHEGANTVVAPDGRVVVYMGDDDRFEHIYKFVSKGRFDPRKPQANRNLLDSGTLYVARFDANGKGQWLPLVYDPAGPLNAEAGFGSQAEVLIKARAAADVLGATPMDRPEDVETNPVTGKLYIACTRNESRTAAAEAKPYAGRTVAAGPDAANPRGQNAWGHIIELQEARNDATAREFAWEVFLLAGDPNNGRLLTRPEELRAGLAQGDTYFAGYGKAADLSPIGSPDNLGFDAAGNLWVVTDGAQPTSTNNGCWVCPTTGPLRGRLQQFMSAPKGAEVCGCRFTPDGETLFLSIQHPGEGGTVLAPTSYWPDGGDRSQPRSSVIAIRRIAGGKIGR